MPSTLPSVLHASLVLRKLYKRGSSFLILILQMRELELRQAEILAKGHALSIGLESPAQGCVAPVHAFNHVKIINLSQIITLFLEFTL